jgi:Plasmid encoded RepA protein
MTKDDDGLRRIGDILPAIIKPEMRPLSPIKQRLIEMPVTDEPDILYQHSVLCQTCMPYRDPGDVRTWQRHNGMIHLLIQAGQALDPSAGAFVDVGLPFGPKPRLVLYHLNTEALRKQSPLIDLEDSLTAFVKRTLGLDPGGRNIRTVKDQLSRLAAADFRLGALYDNRAITVKGTVIEGFELWIPRDPRQRTLWPTTVQFSQRYFESLLRHAVPLNEAAVSRLSHSAMGLDLYTWLAQRLHRIDPKKGAFVPWVSLKEQFGIGYGRMNNFKRDFRTTLKQVHIVYREARFDLDQKGMRLQHSRPPVLRRLIAKA